MIIIKNGLFVVEDCLCYSLAFPIYSCYGNGILFLYNRFIFILQYSLQENRSDWSL